VSGKHHPAVLDPHQRHHPSPPSPDPWLARLSGLDAFWAFAVVTIPIALSVVVADDWMIRMLAYAAVVLSRSPPSVTGGRRVPR